MMLQNGSSLLHPREFQNTVPCFSLSLYHPLPLASYCGCFPPSAPGQEATWLSGEQRACSLNRLYSCVALMLGSQLCLPEG